MPRCAILTLEHADGFSIYDHLLIEPMTAAGWHVDEVAWNAVDADWNQYDAVIIRSTWDYQDYAEQFLAVLESIDASRAILLNKIETVRWNFDKRYLREVEEAGALIVPTLWGEDGLADDPSCYYSQLHCEELVIKPTVSANSDNTFRLVQAEFLKRQNELADIFKHKPFMIQPFMQNIVDEGEYSLFYFGGAYSHAILKTPKSGDFRVQEEHGGVIKSVDASQQMKELANHILCNLNPQPFYARVDFVRLDNSFALMELELIEPSLYFNYDDNSAQRFTDAFVKEMSIEQSK